MDFAAIKAKAEREWNALENLRQPLIYIGMGTCGKAAGAEEIYSTSKKTLSQMNLLGRVLQVGCIGMCYLEPVMAVRKPSGPFIYYGNLTWTVGWFSVFIFATIYNLTHDVSDDTWATFWWVKVIITVVLGVGTTIWFLFGGVRDIRALFHTLATMKRDHRDDGRVVDHHNVADEPLEEEAAGAVE